MERNTQTSIARLMAVVLVAAIGCAALRNASAHWAGLMLLLTCGVLMLGVVGAVCRGPGERARWLGFTLFGGGYLALAHAMAFSPNSLPTITLAEFIGSSLGVQLASSIRNGGGGWESLQPAYRIVHCVWAFALALLGWILAGMLVAQPACAAPTRIEEPRSNQRQSRIRWRWPAIGGLLAFWIVALAATARRWPAPGVWAGVSFLLTCGLLGLAAMGAAFSRDRDRARWLGAALFGFGYLALTFGKSQLFIVAPHLPTEVVLDRLLQRDGPPIRSYFPDFTNDGFARVRNDVIMRKLEQPIPLHFPDGAPLEEVLTYIRGATKDVNFPGMPIYVDPQGLQTAERTMQSPVRIDRDPIPVREALRLCVKQLDLGFTIRSGFIMISDGDSVTLPVYEDPVQVVGHSLFALIAAGLGAAAARFACGRAHRLECADPHHGVRGRVPRDQ